MLRPFKLAVVLATATACALTPLAAQADVTIRPGLAIGAGGSVNAVDAVTHGKEGYIYFRPEHGCVGPNYEVNPWTGLSMSNYRFPTHSFSVTVPIRALGTVSAAEVAASTPSAPRAQYIPGWKSTSKYNAQEKSWTITWTAVSADFDIPDASDNEEDGSDLFGGNVFAEFGVSVRWNNNITNSSVSFPAKQVCSIPKPVASPTAITKSGNDSSRTFTIASKASNANVRVDLKIMGQIATGFENVSLGSTGGRRFTLNLADSDSAANVNAVITVTRHSDGKILGYFGGTTARTVVTSWNGGNAFESNYVNGVWNQFAPAPAITVK